MHGPTNPKNKVLIYVCNADVLWCLMWLFILSAVSIACGFIVIWHSRQVIFNKLHKTLFIYLSFRCILEITCGLSVRLSVNIGAEAAWQSCILPKHFNCVFNLLILVVKLIQG
jgi:hypothetical protein